MINLKIDPEFQSQIPPLTDDEFKQLEENILKEGKLLSPLIVWNNILVDGHNRYAILQKHPEIYFSTMPLPFENREEVLAWICKNQLGRRNLTPEQKYYLMGKQYEAEKAVHGGDRKSTDAKSSSLNANLIDSSKTCDRIAAENGVSKDTVIRASKYMRGVEIAEELMPGLKQSILSGQTKVSKADMHRLAKAAYYDRAQILQDILHPELKVEPTPDADGVIRVPGKAPVMPFRKFESVYDSDAYPEDVRYEYVALEELTTRFRISFNYQLEQMPDNAQRDVILEIMQDMAQQLLFFNTKVRILAQKRLRDRLKIYLQTLTPDSKGCYHLLYSRTELADFLCVDRSALSRELCRMRDEKLLEFSGAKIKILDNDFLRH